MERQQTPLGQCPECGTVIYPSSVLIEYETSDGLDCYAECPECETVAHPEQS